ncbi:dihydropteroate synthase [Gordonia araii NBRC 100433]|uniref:Dihydropteroate synthase n=1 Tax=Gordonia araii NBRC 100433 TaxID=1073574 RepID=G7H2W5_9ACTN|nr:dihydropteroate synthase [Gordonia araii]NNG98326.1 dihydropteroate synthase [Gordonia araii NBRC 100433]GAB10190.1 dihydropteroate synthase [Gordonia araii NBRC 100433]
MDGNGGVKILGVVNVTADSFSDGGRFLDVDAAVAQARALAADGADIVDVGGESTRPGAHRVEAAVEAQRVVPVISALAADGIAVSVDTMRAEVASAAIEAGAVYVNDVSGGRADPSMARVLADAGLPWILMHWRPLTERAGAGPYGPEDFTHRAGQTGAYRDVVGEVSGELLAQVDAAVTAGVDPDRLILDPGLGFAKSAEHNWDLLRGLPTLVGLGFPVLVGASRKRFLGTLLARDGVDRSPAGREVATAAVSALAAAAGVWGVRVHDAAASRDAIRVAQAWTGADRTVETRGAADG